MKNSQKKEILKLVNVISSEILQVKELCVKIYEDNSKIGDSKSSDLSRFKSIIDVNDFDRYLNICVGLFATLQHIKDEIDVEERLSSQKTSFIFLMNAFYSSSSEFIKTYLNQKGFSNPEELKHVRLTYSRLSAIKDISKRISRLIADVEWPVVKDTILESFVQKKFKEAILDKLHSSKLFNKLFGLNGQLSRFETRVVVDKKIINIKFFPNINIYDTITANSEKITIYNFLGNNWSARVKSHLLSVPEYARILLMISNEHYLKKRLTKFIEANFSSIIKQHNDLFRTNNVNLSIVLYTDSGSTAGSYILNRSYYDRIFIEIKIDDDFLAAFANGYSELSVNSKVANALVHEITHSYDWILNSGNSHPLFKVSYDMVKKIIGEEPRIELMAFFNIISHLRSEGIASISGWCKSHFSHSDAISDITFLFVFAMDNSDITKFMGSIMDKEYSAEKLLDKVNDIYNEGNLHQLGEFMVLLMLIYKFKDRIYIIQTINELSIKTRQDLVNHILSLDELRSYQDVQILKAEDLHDIYDKNSIKNLYIYYPFGLQKSFDEFINMLSIMSIDKFLEFYDKIIEELRLPVFIVNKYVLRRLNAISTQKIDKLAVDEGFIKAA